MKKWLVYIMLLLVSGVAMGQTAVGQWRDYLSYNEVNHVAVAKDRVYAAGQMGVFYYDLEDEMMSRMNKTTGLSDVGIATIGCDRGSGWLVIAYNNSNVDLVKDDVVYNISDIKRSNIPGSKTIHSIKFEGGNAYLACGFGIVVIDLERKEIKETYYLGANGEGAPVYDVEFDDDQIYAAMDDGILYADKHNRFLNIIDNWTRDDSEISGHPVIHLAMGEGGLLAAVSMFDPMQLSVYRYKGGNVVEKLCEGEFKSLRCEHNMLLMATEKGAYLYDMEGNLIERLATFTWGELQVNDVAMDAKGVLWMGHEWAGMVRMDRKTGKDETYKIEGPASNNVYSINCFGYRTYVAPGGKRTTNDGVYIPANVYMLEKGAWSALARAGVPDWYDVLNVAVNPFDTNQLLATAWGGGVMEIKDNKVVKCFDETNTDGALRAYTDGNYKSLRVGAVAYDFDGNAWILNSLQDRGLVRYGKDGTWRSWNTAKMVNGAEIDKLIWDSITGYKWFMGSANRIYVHDGEGKMAYVDPNNGSKLETYMVNCMAQDHDGEIWIGTDKGIKVIYDGYKAFSNGGNGEKAPVHCSNILFSEGEVVEYLMAYEGITCIAVDGANRKWIGTMNGLYLISANGQEQLEHFTTANSPLFSDRIVSVAVNPRSGEVMIGTDYGLQSYRGTATYANAWPESNVYAFPNPVKPEYDGVVAIKGFSRNALVHITDVAGHVVYSTTANGGQAIWNTCTDSGERGEEWSVLCLWK